MSKTGFLLGTAVSVKLAVPAIGISAVVCALFNDASFATSLKAGFLTAGCGTVGAIGAGGLLVRDSSIRSLIVMPLLGYAIGAGVGYVYADKTPAYALQRVSTLPQGGVAKRGLDVMIGQQRLTL